MKDDLPADRSGPALDVGCGFGFALRALRASGFSDVRGVEISEQQAEIARRGGFEVAVVSDTAAWLREHQGEFGLILLLDVLEHVPVPGQIDLVRAIRKALRPGGRLIVTVPNANSPLAARWRYIDFTHCGSFTEHSLFFVLCNGGFGKITMDNSKGLGAFPRRWWKLEQRGAVRKWLVRFAWLQVFKAELQESENLDDLCFELNLKAVALNDAA
ncbi:MAG: class I SAM-dependent methyltransferase [Bryobacteraceae bacterium]|nr:class I SAM-dependent methyltransferase [Bryobacteraceae bacterium]